jgi:hypothetical protein
MVFTPSNVRSHLADWAYGKTALGTVSLDSSGIATLIYSSLPVGRDKIIAFYLGNTVFASSQSPPVVQVDQCRYQCVFTRLTGSPQPRERN